ncbi:gluconate 2-dehydrogenase subunit 3 family protein [Sutcliffiella cohnii]|uniref:gluconate 2-dehydrogenase subunit 3 family protein n=1 Tax=Sutcliffiella cohnii TaxID=33932 RepID=UPI002E1F585C|nr:gluconate 2-dehydrogenase subunit 3 family protein [Sutcliffiella cohnii]
MEHPKSPHYEEYNVMDQFHEWDVITQRVIRNRLAASDVSFFTPEEQNTIIALYPIIFPSHLGDIGVNVLALLDQRMRENKINGYVKGTTLQKVDVIRTGLRYVATECYTQFHHPFSTLEKKLQISYVGQLVENIGSSEVWIKITPKLFFTTFTYEILKIIYADPSVWSDIGFGGPAFPRGYYTFGFDQFDPWEAPNNEQNKNH